jgi:hypothetical protein
MVKMTFPSKIRKMGAHSVIELPFHPNSVWGVKKRHDVHGSINAYPYRGPVHSENDRFYLVLGPAWCRDTGLSDGM